MSDALDQLSGPKEGHSEHATARRKPIGFLRNYQPKKETVTLRKDTKFYQSRFLDNHYDDKMHGQAFCVAKKPLRYKYKYTGQGLQHQHEFNRVERKNIDEEIGIERQAEDIFKKLKEDDFKSYEAYQTKLKYQDRAITKYLMDKHTYPEIHMPDLKTGDILIFIQYW